MNLSEKLVPYRSGNKWGFSNLEKKIIVPCIYSGVQPFYKGYAKVTLEYKKVGVLSEDGSIIIPCDYDDISRIYKDGFNDFFITEKKQKYGLHKNKEQIFDIIYEYIDCYLENIFLVYQSYRWKFIDIAQKDLFPQVELKSYRNSSAYDTRGNIRLTQDNIIIHEHFGINVYIDSKKIDLKYKINEIKQIKTKNTILYCALYYEKNYKREEELVSYIFYNSKFELVFPKLDFENFKIRHLVHNSEEDDFLIVEDENYKSYQISENFNDVNPLKYRIPYNFTDGLAIAINYIGGNYLTGFINKNLEIVIPFQFDGAYPFKNGFSIVEKNGLKGIIDTRGNILVPLEYKRIGKIRNEKVAVEFSDGLRSCGFINLNNKIISQTNYLFHYSGPYFTEYDVAVVQKSYQGSGIIDSAGNEILECKYLIKDESFLNGFSIFTTKGVKYGIINYNGEVIIAPKYVSISSYELIAETAFWLINDAEYNRLGYVDQNGNEYWEGDFDIEKAL
jgi:hypothetical protein